MIKTIKKYSAFAFIGLFLLAFTSCDDNSELFTLSASPTAADLAPLPFTQLNLDPVNTANPAMTLNWKAADYGQQASIRYDIEFANDANFTSPVVSSSITGQTSLTLSVAEINAAAGNAGLNPFEWADLHVRVVSSLGTKNSVKVPSNGVSVSVYPYFNYTFNDYYLVGDATAPNWNNNDNNPALFRDPNDANVFYYTGRFAGGGHFKVLQTKGLWQPQWGTDDGVTVGVNPGGGSDPERFPYGGGTGIPEGFYTFTINFASNTFTFVPFNATGITSPGSLTIEGTSTANVSMTPLAFDGHIWYATGVRLTPGDVEFVTDGGARWGSATSFSGTSTDGGGKIPVIVEDDYDIWFNDLTGQYILIPLNL